MQAEHIAQAAEAEQPEPLALSCLSTTTYPTGKDLARRLKLAARKFRLSWAAPLPP